MLDHPLSLDYLPYLRAMAHHEKNVQKKFSDVMQENGGEARSGVITRRGRSNIRRNYLDGCAGGHDMKTIEQKSTFLAKTYMIKE